MHILFVHKNYPAQFGHIVRHLIDDHGFRYTVVPDKPAAKWVARVVLQQLAKISNELPRPVIVGSRKRPESTEGDGAR